MSGDSWSTKRYLPKLCLPSFSASSMPNYHDFGKGRKLHRLEWSIM